MDKGGRKMSLGKEAVGRKAADFVEDGMVVGFGTGSTAYYFIDEVGKRIQEGKLKHVVGVPTSRRTLEQMKSLGIPDRSLDDVNFIDLLVDGADETTRDFNGIKGGGGALLYEKIVAQNSRRIIWIVTEDKVVDTLGKFPLPVEIVQFGSWKLFRKFDQAGMNPTFRKSGEDNLFITDAGNYIVDLHLDEIPNPHQLEFELNNMVGVVDHGLFLNYPDTILTSNSEGTLDVITRN